MTSHKLKVQKRAIIGRQVKKLRAQGLTPANIFGKKITSLNVQVPTKDIQKLLREVGESTLLYIQVEGEKQDRPTLVRDILYHPVTGQILHLSFNQVDLKEKVTAPIKIILIGFAPAEKEKLGILVQQLDEIEIEALPTDIPENVEVDVSGLTAVDSAILVKDIKLGTKLTVKSDLEVIVAKIEPLAKEEVVEKPAVVAPAPGEAPVPAEGEAPATEPKTETKEKKPE